MKPKYRRVAKTIPAIVTLVMSAAVVSNAAVTNDTDGSITITTLNDGPNSAYADGGASPVVEIGAFADINGDAGAQYAVQIDGGDYAVNNLGSIDAHPGKRGIHVTSFAGSDTAIHNSGLISSGERDAIKIEIEGVTVNNLAGASIIGGDDAWDHAIETLDGFTLDNSGIISTVENGGGNAVDVLDDATITNNGIIDGNYDGINAGDDLFLTNLADGAIVGTYYGVNAVDGLILINEGKILSFDEYGVYAGDYALITNSSTGRIFGSAYGVHVTDYLELTNAGSIEGFLNAGIHANNHATITNTGEILSAFYGIELNDNGHVTNSGLITQNFSFGFGFFAGIIAGDHLTVDNQETGEITGDYGIDVDDDFTLTNAGIITGTKNDGVNAIDDAYINNSGTITGGNDGIEVKDDATIINSGTITTGIDYGINAGDNLYLENLADGVIFGFDVGVDATDDAEIINHGSIEGDNYGIYVKNNLNLTNSGTITGTSNDGVKAVHDAYINNSGTITGGNDGIQVKDYATIINSGTITTDIDYGINAGDNLYLENLAGGVIFGFDRGVDAIDDAEIINDGSIEGENYGINVDDNAVMTNSGTVTATNGDAIYAEDNAYITNSGTITAEVGGDGICLYNGVVTNSGTIISNDDDGIDVDGLLGESFTLNNSGYIYGSDTSFTGSNSDDTLNLAFGSRLVGEVLGYGGTDTINFDGGLVSSMNSADGAFSNSILGNVYGFETINKTGTGVAFIGVPGNGGFDVEVDVINITGGGLYINGNIFPDMDAQTTINAGGAALGGTGTWSADVNITNGVLPGGFSAGAIPINLDSNSVNSIGQVTVNGTVTHSPGTFIRFDVNPGTVINDGANSDLIVINGAPYNLNGADVRISPTSNNTPITSGTYTIVDGEFGAVNGPIGSLGIQFNQNVNAADTDFQGFLTGFTGQNVTDALLVTEFSSLSIVPNGAGQNLILTIDRDFSAIAGLSGSQLAFATALDASLGVNDAGLQDFIASLDYSTLDDVLDSFTAITTLDTFGSTAAVVSSNYQTNRVVQNHLSMTRSQSGTISRTYVGSYAEPAPEPIQAPGNRFNAWGSVSYDWRDSEGFGNSDIDGEEASFLAGIDYRVATKFLLGILAEGSNADYDFNGGGSDVDTLRGAIYGTYGEATGFYADFLLGFGDHDFDSSFAGIGSDTDASSIQAMLTAGYTIQSGRVKHGPFGGVEYTNVDVDSYNVGGLIPVKVGSYDVESTRLFIGYRAEAEAGRFTPYASVAYAHELENGNQGAKGTLPGGAAFAMTGGNLDSAFLISVGTGYSITENLGLNFGYHGEISTGDGIDSHGATIGLNYAF